MQAYRYRSSRPFVCLFGCRFRFPFASAYGVYLWSSGICGEGFGARRPWPYRVGR